MNDTSGPAFPVITDRDMVAGTETVNLGLTRRELFAAMAMQGLLANVETAVNARVLSEEAVKYADAMLAELAKGGKA